MVELAEKTGMRAISALIIAFFISPNVGADPTVARILIENERGELIYVVNERAPSLSAIARELYGDRRMADRIAEWNGLPRESWLKRGQVLRIKKAPRLNHEQGTDLLIRYWHIGRRPDLVERLRALRGHAPAAETRPTVATKLPPKRRLPPVQEKARQQARAKPKGGVIAEAGDGEVDGSGETVVFKRRPSATAKEDDDANKEPKSDSYWLGSYAEELIQLIRSKLGGERQGENRK